MNGRSPLWYKSGGFLYGVFAGGLILVVGIGSPLLYQQHVKLQAQKNRVASMQTYIAEHKSTVQLAGNGLRIPTREELEAMQKKIPTEASIPSFLQEIQTKATEAGVKWTGARFAFTREELDQELEKGKTVEQKLLEEVTKYGKKEASPKTKPVPSHVRAVWADVYVEATIAQVKTWFQKLKESERIMRIEEWENKVVTEAGAKGNTRVRLIFYIYQDPGLKIPSSANQPPSLTTPPTSTETIQVLPPSSTQADENKEEEMEKEDQKPTQQPNTNNPSSNQPNPPSTKQPSTGTNNDTGSVTAPSS
ncbi:hypothetical protein ACFO25_11955 [Paenactinomyces guangxiensis]|uniref:Uncharacterized protein n=1 Tax=Paenactinomyces guangxiensis TaxID=1490290 RepID=A0A7W1WU83_9BACL|nr:hypothetical protein [Paenactinomyces guangxiensis]MBA4496150.1 hypothetical protein [Paenactinomyces guangxiensis]MBH8593238.1 hypothetical protein [Paenactinomyces guangxiensis]